jgi:hypothetical protein
LNPTFSVSPISIKATGISIPGALDRQQKIAGFDQQKYSRSHVLCIGAGGLMSNIAPALVRKGIGRLTVLDHDEVDASNLNRQRFYPGDVGQNKAIALIQNLQRECTCSTGLVGYAMSFETAIHERIDLTCDVVVCAVDNNAARIAASRVLKRGIFRLYLRLLVAIPIMAMYLFRKRLALVLDVCFLILKKIRFFLAQEHRPLPRSYN